MIRAFPTRTDSVKFFRVLSTAYKIARAEGSNIVTLQDGQSQILERAEVLDRVVSFMLLDADGEEVRPVSVPLDGSH